MIELRPGTNVTASIRLLRPIGRGGMGRVWVAEHLKLQTNVVVKFMAEDMASNADAAARFSREASVAASVKSPHVAQVFDHGVTEDGQAYIVMELLDGRDLAQHLAANGPMAPADVAALIAQIAKALGKAHHLGIVHRDIKPDNIFLCESEGETFVKLLDFGIAKQEHRVEGNATTTGMVIGTPYYMSPEQILGEKDVDTRTDIWSLGVVAFEAITGRRPFSGPTVGAITLAIHQSTPRITELRPDAPAALDTWFARACARDLEARFRTAREASQALSMAAYGAADSQPLLRAPFLSLPDPSDPVLPSAAASRDPLQSTDGFDARGGPNLSSAVPLANPRRARPAVVVGSVAFLAIAAVIGGVAILRSGSSTVAASPAGAPPIPLHVPSQVPSGDLGSTSLPAPSTAPAATTTAEEMATPSATSSSPTGLATSAPPLTRPIPRPSARPTTSAKPHLRPRRDDDDIK